MASNLKYQSSAEVPERKRFSKKTKQKTIKVIKQKVENIDP